MAFMKWVWFCLRSSLPPLIMKEVIHRLAINIVDELRSYRCELLKLQTDGWLSSGNQLSSQRESKSWLDH